MITIPKNPKAEDLGPILVALADQLAALEARIAAVEAVCRNGWLVTQVENRR